MKWFTCAGVIKIRLGHYTETVVMTGALHVVKGREIIRLYTKGR